MFSTAPVRGLSFWCHQCPAGACGQKTTLRAPRWRSSRGTAPNRKSRPAAGGGHRGVATRKTTGDPERRAEWTTVLRYGHLLSAPVVVGGDFRTEWEPPALRAPLWDSTRYPVLSGSPVRADPHTTSGAKICRRMIGFSTQSPLAGRDWKSLLVSPSGMMVLTPVGGSRAKNSWSYLRLCSSTEWSARALRAQVQEVAKDAFRSFLFLPLRAVGVDAPSKLYSNFGTFAVHTDARSATSRFRTTELVWRLLNISGSQRESTMKLVQPLFTGVVLLGDGVQRTTGLSVLCKSDVSVVLAIAVLHYQLVFVHGCDV